MDPGLRDWVHRSLSVREITATRTRLWADLWRVEAVEGLWWLKVNKAGTVHEPALLRLLAARPHPLVPASITHPSEPWSLIQDAGVSLRQRLPGFDRATLGRFWSDLLADYAELQRSTTAAELLAAGVPDYRTAVLPARFLALWQRAEWFGRPAVELAPERRAAMERLAPLIELAAARVTGSGTGVLDSLQHDDLHDDNVLVPEGFDPGSGRGPRATDRRVIDWGDAAVSHPFGTLRLTLDSLAESLAELPGDTDPAAEVARVRSAYLEGWRVGGVTEAELVAEAGLVHWLECLLRAACWVRALGDVPTALAAGDVDAPARWLERMVDEAPEALGVRP